MMLEGIRVIDLGSFITAPLAAMMLGDLGADVIKVERPQGDPFRTSHGDRYGPTFLAFNRNKRSMIVDSTTPEGQRALHRLIETADVVIDNYRTSVLKKLGLDPQALRERNPRLIHCSITGFGPDGPYQARPAFDSVGQALSGISSMMVDPDDPKAFGITISDNATGMYAAYAVLGALVERNRTGVGRRLEVNMLESSISFIQDLFLNYTQKGEVSRPRTRIMRSQCFIVGCADGKLLALHMSTTEKFWREVAEAIGMAELVDDPRFANHGERVKNYPELEEILNARFRERPRAQWVAAFAQADVPYAEVNTVDEVLADEQVKALGSAVTMQHPERGKVTSVQTPVFVDGARPREPMVAPPVLGEHTREICAELGIDADELEAARKAGV